MFALNIKGQLRHFDRPAVMGIVNITTDSFYAGSRAFDVDTIGRRVEQLIAEGADILDIGAYSTRPGADDVPPEEEMERLSRAMGVIRRLDKQIPVSVDTFRAEVARVAVEQLDCDIVNDVSGGTLDNDMFDTVAHLHCPYILMHMRGTPQTMQQLTDYPRGVVADVLSELAVNVQRLNSLGVADVIIDPGFGFAKSLQQNYTLMHHLADFGVFGLPVLVGISRKSMLTNLLDIRAANALEATVALNTLALDRGANILRVHDVACARQATTIFQTLKNAQ